MLRGIRNYIYTVIAAEISSLTRYYDRLIQWLPRKEDDGLLLNLCRCESKQVIRDDQFPDCSEEFYSRTAVLINGSLNYNYDIQGMLLGLKSKLSRNSRLIIVLYNPYLNWFYKLANKLGIRRGETATTFISRNNLENISRISGFSISRTRLALYCPFRLLGLGDLINVIMPVVPLFRWLSLVYIAVLRPIIPDIKRMPSVSCIVPAKNEKGNIEEIVRRMPDLDCRQEIIFVEGHSTDGTWEEIGRVSEKFKNTFKISSYQQEGTGKSDAVRFGMSKADNDLLVILDADMTMPPELLSRFYRAYVEGHADFVNGSRLIYPMEGQAMRFLNKMGNAFFALALSWALDVRIGDSLCGTKLFARHDFNRIMKWRKDFGEFDPFGDFELLFPAAVLGLGIVDVPIRYMDRVYGTTNISRFRHGFMLLKMTVIGALRIKTGGALRIKTG